MSVPKIMETEEISRTAASIMLATCGTVQDELHDGQTHVYVYVYPATGAITALAWHVPPVADDPWLVGKFRIRQS